MKIGKLFAASAGTLLACQVMATPVTWLRDGDLDVSESVAANGDGSYTYNLSLVNGDASGIWFAGFYTGEYHAYAIQSSLSAWQANAYDSWLPAGEDWSLPDAADAWMVSFHDDDPLTASLVAGGTATLSFTLGGLLEAPIRYGYFVEGDHEWNRYSAVGPAAPAVPEPSSLAFLGLGLLAITAMTLRRRKFHSHGPTLAGAVLAILVSGTVGAHAASDIAISQVYGGGGNSGATFTHDFIELHNRGAGPVDLTGWSVQYASASGATWQRTALSGTLPAGGYYLVRQAQGAGGTQPLPAPDAIGSIVMSATAGKVALSSTFTLLTGTCPTGLVDQVGYGSANCFEGSGAAPGLSNSTAGLRGDAGCADTDRNASDFTSGSPAPRNSSTPAFACDGVTPPPDPDSALSPVKISTIQGKGHLSPLAGQDVTGVEGVVTAVSANGFYLQDPQPDSDPATSEALFVFTSASPAVKAGDAARVNGRVSEFRPGGSGGNNLTLTQLVSSAVTVLSTGNALPEATLVGLGSRVPPPEVIDDDAVGSVETSGSFDHDADGIDFWESLEAMRVKVIDPVVVGPRNGFGEFVVLADAGNGAAPRTARGGIKVSAHDFNPERIMVDDLLMATPSVNVGDAFAGPIEGVLDYAFGNFKIEPASLPPTISSGLSREVSGNDCAGMLTVATFNVENLDALDPQEKFDRLAAAIVNNLRSPLLMALEEVQDDNGPVNDSIVDATRTAARLIAAIQGAGGPAYQYRDIAPRRLQDGGEPGGNIRVGFLYRQDQGLVFINRPGGTAVNSVKALKTPTGVRLNYSPGRIDPLNPAFADSRKPLVGEFSHEGRTFFVVANHFNSKGGDHPLSGQFQPPVRSSEVQRNQQAQAVNAFVQSVLDKDPCARVIVLGDFNDFEFSDALTRLKGAALANLMEYLPENERYSYVFEGNSQSLDHILVSRTLAESPSTWYDVVHMNAEFADQVSDHEPQRACFEKGPPNCQISFP